MFVKNFYHCDQGKVVFTRQQASDFAKQVADDFNPLHDIDAKRFCVPGDLLFAVTLAKAGIYNEMRFNFAGMVTNDIVLSFPENIDQKADVTDDKGKTYLSVEASGESSKNSDFIESLIKAYVGFSGHTFPHLLVNLMEENNVMINPARPMIMYESMSLHINDLSATDVNLTLSETSLKVEGKRGNAELCFNLYSGDKLVGKGEKHMVLSGLREYCHQTMSTISADYLALKKAYTAAV